MKLFLEHFYIMTNDSNIDFQMNSTHNHLQKILFPITAGIILEKCFITVVLYRQVLWGVHRFKDIVPNLGEGSDGLTKP